MKLEGDEGKERSAIFTDASALCLHSAEIFSRKIRRTAPCGTPQNTTSIRTITAQFSHLTHSLSELIRMQPLYLANSLTHPIRIKFNFYSRQNVHATRCFECYPSVMFIAYHKKRELQIANCKAIVFESYSSPSYPCPSWSIPLIISLVCVVVAMDIFGLVTAVSSLCWIYKFTMTANICVLLVL
jgi:hypothetical protein